MPSYSRKNIVLLMAAVVFGLAGGLVGSLLARAYIIEDAFNIPLFGELNFTDDVGGGSSLVIHNARNVVVEQDVKVAEAVQSALPGLLAFYRLDPALRAPADRATATELTVDDYLPLYQAEALGYALTSDGWLVSDYSPSGLDAIAKAAGTSSREQAKVDLLEDLILVDYDRQVFFPDDLVVDPISGYSFWHIPANDLPVKQFVSSRDIETGRLALAVNWRGWGHLATVEGIERPPAGSVRSSDRLDYRLLMSPAPGPAYHGSFVFDLGGSLLALLDAEGQVRPIDNLLGCINCLLENRSIERPVLGVNYIYLPELVNPLGSPPSLGALIQPDANGVAVIPDSPAGRAGLVSGDIILALDGIELKNGNDLAVLVSRYLPGQAITLDFLRDGERRRIQLELGAR